MSKYIEMIDRGMFNKNGSLFQIRMGRIPPNYLVYLQRSFSGRIAVHDGIVSVKVNHPSEKWAIADFQTRVSRYLPCKTV